MKHLKLSAVVVGEKLLGDECALYLMKPYSPVILVIYMQTVIMFPMTYQQIRYARACYVYQDFITRARQLATKLLAQGYVKPRLVSTIKNGTISLLQITTFQSNSLYVAFWKQVKLSVSFSVATYA